ncbi:type 1 glutamine amidotransferase [Candidatus Daviesbacteria bacterium]|nr:type 1 glutamine amidotransferase [Candidatus Daviesbacteria bacterium]
MKRILVLQHVENESPGRLQSVAKKFGAVLDRVELWKSGCRMPDIGQYQGLIILGGPMGVYENYSSEAEELEVIRKADELTIPTMGFCLGSQLIAHYLAADVHKNIKDGKHVKEIGYYDVELTGEAADDPLLKDFSSPLKVLQWHGDAFDLPEEATLLATAPLCENQAFRIRNMWAFLFHFEFTPDMIRRQIEVDREWIHKDFDIVEEEVVAKAEELDGLMDEQCGKLFNNFLSMVKSK